jgi:phage portal protein BeeE
MNLLDRAKTAIHVFRHGTALPHLMQRKDAPFLWPDFRSGVPQWKMYPYRTYVNEGFNQNALIYSAIMYKVRAMTIAPLRAWRGDPEDRELLDEGSPLQQLVSRPNRHQGWSEFQGQAVVYLNISGNNFTFLDRDNPEKLPDAMLNLRPDRVFVVPGRVDGQATILGYLYVPEGKSALGRMTPEARIEALEHGDIVPILPSDMMHVKLPNPLDELEGMGEGLSPISCIAWTTDVDNAVTQFLKLFFEKGIVIPGMVTTDKVNLSENIIARLKERWKQTYGGFENWGEEIFVADHGLKYQRIGLTFDEMGFKEIDARSESRILAPFGVPGALIGTRLGLDRAIESNLVELRKTFWQDTMVPESQLFETEFQFFLRGDSGEFVAYDYSKVPALQEVVLSIQAQRLDDFKAGAITRNEYRQVLRLPDDPSGDVYVLPLSFIETPFGAAPELPSQDDGTGAQPTMEEAPEAEEDDRKILTLPLKKKGIGFQARQFLWKQVDGIAESWDSRYSSRAKKAFENDRRAVLARLQKGKQQALEQKATVDYQAVNRDWDAYFATQAPENWREEFLPVIEGLIVDQGNAWNTAFGMQFNVRNLFAEQWFRDYMLEFSEDINKTTKDNLSVLLEQGMREGWSTDQVRKQIGLEFDRYTDPNFRLDGRRLTEQERQWFEDRSPRYRREMIARTETIRASNAGSIELFKAWGVVEKKEWLATGDDRTRDTHLDAWARYSEGGSPGPIPLGRAFIVGGASLMYPGDPRGPAEETIQCRCVPLPFFDEAAGTPEQIAEQQEMIEAERQRRRVVEKPLTIGGRAPVGPDITTLKADEFLVQGFIDPSDINLAWGHPWGDLTITERAQAKDELIKAISVRSGASYEDVNKLIAEWSQTSNDDDMRALAIQKAAAEQFGIPLSDFTQGKIDTMLREMEATFDRSFTVDELFALRDTDIPVGRFRTERLRQSQVPLFSQEGQRKMIDSMYDYTQEQLAIVGFSPEDTIRLRRGVGLPKDVVKNWSANDTVDIIGNTLESWSVGEDIANTFARDRVSSELNGIVFEMDIPVSQIVGTARTGFGCLIEGEFVVKGSIKGTAQVVEILR